MRCPSWLWPRLLRKHWPTTFLDARVVEAIDWLRRYPDLPTTDQSPIFIFSSGWRSGSTLLQRLLNSGREVFIWGEPYEPSQLLFHLCSSLAMLGMSPLEVDFLPEHGALAQGSVNSLLTTKWIANLTPPVSDLKRAHWAYHDALFGVPAARAGRPRWGVKLVRSTAEVARYVRWLYPKAKLLFLFRDPYASFRSYINSTERGWYLYYPSHRVRGVVPFAVHWRHCMESFLSAREELDVFMISYESMINRTILGPLQEYMGLQLDENVLDLKVDFKNRSSRNPKGLELKTLGFIAGELADRIRYSPGGAVPDQPGRAGPSAPVPSD